MYPSANWAVTSGRNLPGSKVKLGIRYRNGPKAILSGRMPGPNMIKTAIPISLEELRKIEAVVGAVS